MEFLADFHIHSRFSRATSRELNLESLHASAMLKGLSVVGTGDVTHPGWFQEIEEKLEPAEDGLFRLRKELAGPVQRQVPSSCRDDVRFVLTTEISSIYKKGGQVRKVHNLLFVPSLDAVRRLAGRLEKVGNIHSDGRPILGLDSKDLLALVLEVSPDAFLVPAHIWTPWFSVLGSKSGFDSIEACFEDLAAQIFALETGLSADPGMCGRLTGLDRYSLISNSDAHSPDKLGREANILSCEMSYFSIRDSLRDLKREGFVGTIEFFPEQGKYHLDGHRKCQCRMEPRETLLQRGLCPVCGRQVTVGVMHRVEALADRPDGQRPPDALPYERLISLNEVFGEARGTSPQTIPVHKACRALIGRLGPELMILRTIPLEEIERTAGSLVAEGIRRMRQGEVQVDAGFDGEFGTVRLFQDGERERFAGQVLLDGLACEESGPEGKSKGKKGKGKREGKPGAPSVDATEGLLSGRGPMPSEEKEAPAAGALWGPLFSSRRLSAWSLELLESLNPEQQEAVLWRGSALLIVAGPGTGKTMTLTCRIAYLIEEAGVPADRILAVTFTLKAAREMEERLRSLLQASAGGAVVRVRTFHALGVELLRQSGSALGVPENFFVLDSRDQEGLLRRAQTNLTQREAQILLERISLEKRSLRYPEDGEGQFEDPEFFRAYLAYQKALEERRALDFDDLVSLSVRAMTRSPEFHDQVQGQFEAICVDEYQDVNLAQYRFLRLLADSRQNLCIIGDPDQAIYGFRGASPEYFRQFENDWPQGRVLRLIRNYRSTSAILTSSCKMLLGGSNRRRQVKGSPALVAAIQTGPPVFLAELSTEKAEAIFVAQTIERLMGGTDSLSLYAGRVALEERFSCRSFGEIAVLFRLGAQAPVLEDALRYQGIPFQSTTQVDRWQTPEGRTLIAVLRWLRDPDDSLAQEQIRTGVGDRSGSLLEALLRYRAKTDLGLMPMEERLAGLRSLEALPSKEAGWRESWETMQRLAVMESLADWDGLLRSIRLAQGPDLLEEKSEKVTLATLHASKGLEFPVVFIVGCEEDLLPCRMGREPSDPEEERRLFYVGMTRARHLLYICHTRSRLLFGERRSAPASPFLRDLPRESLERIRWEGREERKKGRPEDLQPSLFKLE